MELDESKELLEIKQVKNLHKLSKIIKSSWGDLNDYLNGGNRERRYLNCGVPMPFIKRGLKHIYLISENEEWIKMKNRRYISREIMEDLRFIGKYTDITPTAHKRVI